MSKKKSLGSSPIGFQSNSSSMGFIPDLGVSESKQKEESQYSTAAKNRRNHRTSDNKTPKKKIVSYSLEASLINKVKTVADKKELYYSSLVSMAIKSWIAENT